jgi:hypothetical protein
LNLTRRVLGAGILDPGCG